MLSQGTVILSMSIYNMCLVYMFGGYSCIFCTSRNMMTFNVLYYGCLEAPMIVAHFLRYRVQIFISSFHKCEFSVKCVPGVEPAWQ